MMKRRRVWRYSCDFCRKSGCSASHMAKHERGCTANPDRVCSAHLALSENKVQPTIAALVAVLKGIDPIVEVEQLRKIAGGCPMCMLAGIRQSGKQTPPDEDGLGFGFPFYFREELKKRWAAYNEAHAEAEHY